MRISIVIIFLSICLPSQGQKLSAGLESGYGFYNMSSLRQKETIVGGNIIPYKNVQNFPATPFVRGFVRVQIRNIWSTGMTLGYLRTGSRSAYSDYSGTAYRDVVVNGFLAGSSNLFQVYTTGNYLVNARINIGALFNSTNFQHSINLHDPTYSEDRRSKFTSINSYFSFGADVSRTLGRFALVLFVEYEFNVSGEPKLKSSIFSTPPPADFDVDWSGVRAGVSCAFQFHKEP
ncbi:hypothetical protein [Chryseolinea sp. H1M3-3]|uniref:hypothetical protein n=1 Tax=Chryseolinea sp. H1M3-3 TaxID=3034144 RepID=UPI0023EE0825|nr:hypothetical protein [Chryseolinea sp. H1M3-3]